MSMTSTTKKTSCTICNMFEITKNRSILIKGIVIIMMVFLHLFNGNNTEQCTNLLYIGNEPFAKWLSHACNPVPFYVLLCGYGLAYTYKNSDLGFTKQLRRIAKLYVHYWIILAVFLIIGWNLHPERYVLTWTRILVNMIGWETNYNHEMWFLFPYSMIALTSRYIIQTVEKIGYLKAVVITAIINFCACYVISLYHSTVLADNHWLNWCIVYLQFLYPFTVGVFFCCTSFQCHCQMSTWLVLIIMAFSVIVVAFIDVSVTSIVYVPLMIFLFCQLPYPKWLERAFMELGRKSMPMWMIHTWFCYYLFKEEVYSLKYPVLILGGTLIVSYLTAIPFMWLIGKVFAMVSSTIHCRRNHCAYGR